MNPSEQATIDRAIARLRAGEALDGAFMYDHGLEAPLVARSTLRAVDGAFAYTTWVEEPVVPTVPMNASTRALDEPGVRAVLTTDVPLRALLGLR